MLRKSLDLTQALFFLRIVKKVNLNFFELKSLGKYVTKFCSTWKLCSIFIFPKSTIFEPKELKIKDNETHNVWCFIQIEMVGLVTKIE